MRLDKRRSALAVAVPAAVFIALSAQVWVRGTTGDVLSGGTVDVTGGGAAPGAVGLAVICVVALLALMTGGRVIRSASAVVMVVAGLGALVVTASVVLRPREVVGDALSEQLARTTAPDATGATTGWGWLAVVAAAALVCGTVVAAVSSRSWSGLSSRYDRTKPASGPRGEVRTTWDELSEGHDPTLRDEPDRT
jgi:hypothetical protein